MAGTLTADLDNFVICVAVAIRSWATCHAMPNLGRSHDFMPNSTRKETIRPEAVKRPNRHVHVYDCLLEREDRKLTSEPHVEIMLNAFRHFRNNCLEHLMT